MIGLSDAASDPKAKQDWLSSHYKNLLSDNVNAGQYNIKLGPQQYIIPTSIDRIMTDAAVLQLTASVARAVSSYQGYQVQMAITTWIQIMGHDFFENVSTYESQPGTPMGLVDYQDNVDFVMW